MVGAWLHGALEKGQAARGPITSVLETGYALVEFRGRGVDDGASSEWCHPPLLEILICKGLKNELGDSDDIEAQNPGIQ